MICAAALRLNPMSISEQDWPLSRKYRYPSDLNFYCSEEVNCDRSKMYVNVNIFHEASTVDIHFVKDNQRRNEVHHIFRMSQDCFCLSYIIEARNTDSLWKISDTKVDSNVTGV